MTTYTEDDFAKAKFATDESGWNVACRDGSQDGLPWLVGKSAHRASDKDLADASWVPVPAGSYTRTDEEIDPERARSLVQERDELAEALDTTMGRAIKAEKERDAAQAEAAMCQTSLAGQIRRAELAEDALVEMTAHRDQSRDTAIKWQMEANRAEQARALTPDDISEAEWDQIAARAWEYWENHTVLNSHGLKRMMQAALIAPTRPEGAAELHQVLDAIYQDEPGITHRGNFADMLATYGVRVASVGLTPTNPEKEQA